MYTEMPLRHQPSMHSYTNWNLTSWSIINMKHTVVGWLILIWYFLLLRLQPLIYRKTNFPYKANSSMWNHHLLKTFFPYLNIYWASLKFKIFFVVFMLNVSSYTSFALFVDSTWFFFHNLCLVDTKDVKNVPKIGILFAFISLTTFTVPTKHYY